MRVDKLIELREKIGNEPIMPDAEDKYEVMQMMKQPQTMEEMQAAARLRTQEDPEYSARYKAPRQKPLYEGGQPINQEQLADIASRKLAIATDPEYSSQFRNSKDTQPITSEEVDNIASAGRMGDTMLMHVSPEEVKGLASLRPVTRNPDTGLPEAILPVGAMIGPALAGLTTVPAAIGGTAAAAGALAAGSAMATTPILPYVAGGGVYGTLGTGSGYAGGAFAAQPTLWNSLGNAATSLWEGYQSMNPVFQGALEGALTTPVMNALTGQETEAEDVMTGAVLGATLAGVKGESFLGGLGKDAAAKTGEKVVETTVEKVGEEATEKGLFDTFLSQAKDTLTDPLALGLAALSLTSAFSTPQQQALGTPRRVAPFDPADPQFARTAIDVDPVTGEDRFSEESLVSRVVEEGEGRGLGRQLTDAFTDPSEEIEVAQAAGGGIVSLYTGGGAHSPGGPMGPALPGSHEYHQQTGSWYPANYHPYQNPFGHLKKKDKGGGGAPEEEAKVFTPFTSRTADFDVDDRLARILGSEEAIDTAPTTPIFVPSGSNAPISATPTNIPAGDAALENLLSRFKAKREDPIVASVAPVVEGSSRGGLVSLAHGGEPTAQNMPIFEGQVPLNGDGMDDEVPYNVVPQTPEDAPDTPDMALLSSDEYVLPADVVSMLGNGSSNAGAQALDRFTKLIRKKAHGTNKQQTELNEDKELSNLIS